MFLVVMEKITVKLTKYTFLILVPAFIFPDSCLLLFVVFPFFCWQYVPELKVCILVCVLFFAVVKNDCFFFFCYGYIVWLIRYYKSWLY